MRPVDRATRRHLIDTISSRGRRPRDSIALQEYSENFETKMVRRMHTPPTNHHTSEEKMVQALENLQEYSENFETKMVRRMHTPLRITTPRRRRWSRRSRTSLLLTAIP